MVKKRLFIILSVYCGLILVTLWTIFPLLFTIITSFKPNLAGLSEGNPFIFPPNLDNYINVWQQTDFLRYLLNSLLVSICACTISIVMGLLAAYALARLLFKGRSFWAQGFLSIRLAPPIAFVVPFFMMFKTLRLLDTPVALILVYTVFLLPFSIWMFSAYISKIPLEAEEAALVDGYTRLGALFKVVLPQLWPAVGAVALLNLTAAWNEFLFALILTGSKSITLPVAISGFFGERGVFWGQMAAATVMILMVPCVISIAIHQSMATAMKKEIGN